MEQHEITAVLNRPISKELLAGATTRLAYVAEDGTPRTVPMGFTWNGSQVVLCTILKAPKLPALRTNPQVALTIDTTGQPPRVLLIRGRSELDVVDGIPEEYWQMNRVQDMEPEQRTAFESEIRSLHEGMTRIVVTPTWAKLIDFETTLPSGLEDLIKERAQRQGA